MVVSQKEFITFMTPASHWSVYIDPAEVCGVEPIPAMPATPARKPTSMILLSSGHSVEVIQDPASVAIQITEYLARQKDRQA